MVHRSLKSLSQRDTELARQVIADDDRVDAVYDRIKRRIELELDRIPENASPLLKLEYLARQFERMADVATNIAEEVIFVVEGQIIRHQ
jgi:phosphate transport system protein